MKYRIGEKPKSPFRKVSRPTVAERVELAKKEILEDVRDGRIPTSVRSFSELHDYVDANGYGGWYEESGRWAPPNMGPTVLREMNAMSDHVDRWLSSGALEKSGHRNPKRKNPSDAQVIKAFTEQRAAASSKLQTDGRRLNGLWMGGNGIATWEGGKIHFQDLGSKAAQSVQKAVAKEAPRNWIGAGSEWALPKRRNPLSPYARMQHKAGFKAPPKPKFKIGYYVEDNYGDGDLHTRPGRVTFVGSYTEPYAAYEKGGVAYEGHSGGYKYKVQEPDGRVLWRDEQRLRRIKAPRSRKNPPSSGLGGTYAIMHANPAQDGVFSVIVHKDGRSVKSATYTTKDHRGAYDSYRSKVFYWRGETPKGSRVVVSLWYQDPGGAKRLEAQQVIEPKSLWHHTKRALGIRANPDLSGPLTITHDGPDLVITHKVNPSSRAPFGWAKVESGVVAKISRSSRKPGRGWGAINTSGTRVGDRAYLDGGDVYLR